MPLWSLRHSVVNNNQLYLIDIPPWEFTGQRNGMFGVKSFEFCPSSSNCQIWFFSSMPRLNCSTVIWWSDRVICPYPSTNSQISAAWIFIAEQLFSTFKITGLHQWISKHHDFASTFGKIRNFLDALINGTTLTFDPTLMPSNWVKPESLPHIFRI